MARASQDAARAQARVQRDYLLLLGAGGTLPAVTQPI
jgi:hypothetical protein